MANVLKAVVTAEIKNYIDGMAGVAKSSLKASTLAIGAFAAISAAFVATAKAINDLSDKVATHAGEYEMLELRMRRASKTAKEAKADFEGIKNLAIETPFETDQLIKASIQLKTVTDSALGTTKSMQMVVDTAAKLKTSGDFQRFITNIGRLKVKLDTGQRAIARELRALQETGALGKQDFVRIQELRGAGESNAKIWAVVENSMKRNKGAARELGQTYKGLQSTLRGTIFDFFAELGGGKGLEARKARVRGFIELINKLKETKGFDDLKKSLTGFNSALNNLLGLEEDDGSALLSLLAKITDMLSGIVNMMAQIKDSADILFHPIDAFQEITEHGTVEAIKNVAESGTEVFRVNVGDADNLIDSIIKGKGFREESKISRKREVEIKTLTEIEKIKKNTASSAKSNGNLRENPSEVEGEIKK